MYKIIFCLLFSLTVFSKEDPKKFNQQILWNQKEQKHWYEWWYFKVIEPESRKSFYFVYGLVNPWDSSRVLPGSKAFVSSGSFDQKTIVEQKFSPQDFSSTKDQIIQIGGKNSFNENRLTGDIVNEKGERVRWDLCSSFDWGFNAMGWAMFVSEISNIYWYPAQASVRVNGWIEFNGIKTEIKNALGYQDRNWGRSFPKWWAWLVSNNFKNSPGTVLAAGGGKPKVLNLIGIVEGFTIGLRHKSKEYSWRISDLDKIKIDIEFGKWNVSAINRKKQRIEISAYAEKDKFMLLPFTTPQGQIFKDYEALTGNMRIQLFEANKLIADLESDEAGIEFGSFNDLLSTPFHFSSDQIR